MARRSSVLLAAILAVAVPAAPVIAGPAGKPSPQQVAKTYVDAGVAAQNNGDYDTALEFFAKAYELVPHPVLLFNMAQANRLAGRLEPALALYQQYVAAEPKGAQVKIAREFITALGVQLDAEAAREAEEAKRAEDAKQAAEAQRAAEAQQAEDAKRAEDERREDERLHQYDAERPGWGTQAEADEHDRRDADARARRGHGLRLVGLIGAGVGVAGIGAGVFYGLRARSLSDDLSTPGHVYDPGDDADGKSAETRMIIATAAGGALLIGGVVVYLIGRKRGHAEAPQTVLAPVPVPGGAAVVAEGRW